MLTHFHVCKCDQLQAIHHFTKRETFDFYSVYITFKSALLAHLYLYSHFTGPIFYASARARSRAHSQRDRERDTDTKRHQ